MDTVSMGLLVIPLIIYVKKLYEGACYKNLKMELPVYAGEHDDVKNSSNLHQWTKIFTVNSSIFYFYFLRGGY